MLDERQTLWSVATAGDHPATTVHGRWHVTNVSKRNVVLLRARLENYEARDTIIVTAEADPADLGRPHVGSNVPILAGHMSGITVLLTYIPAICHGREPLVADVIFTDNYEGEHRVRSVRFPYQRSGSRFKTKKRFLCQHSRGCRCICHARVTRAWSEVANCTLFEFLMLRLKQFGA